MIIECRHGVPVDFLLLARKQIMQRTVERLIKLANAMDAAGLTTEASFLDKTLEYVAKPFQGQKQKVDLSKIDKNDIFNDPTMLDDDVPEQDPNYVPGQRTVWDELVEAV